MHRILATSLTLAILARAASAALGAEAEPLRDPAYWPFDAASPWNMPIGDGAQYGDIAAPYFDLAASGGMNCRIWSHPIFVANSDDPETAIYPSGSETPLLTMRTPCAAFPDEKSDGHLHIIDPTHHFVVEMWQASKRPDGSIVATAVVKNDLFDRGVYDGWHGVRGYGGSAIAGLIRRGELTDGIRHVLAAAVHPKAHNRLGPDGKPYVWPASSADGDFETAYSTTGNLYMGSLLAIPPSVDLSKLGLSGPELALAGALQDYGAYIVDSAHTNIVFFAEPTAEQEVAGLSGEGMRKIVSLLKLVTNNTPQSVGGGGTPRRPLAPSLKASP